MSGSKKQATIFRGCASQDNTESRLKAKNKEAKKLRSNNRVSDSIEVYLL